VVCDVFACFFDGGDSGTELLSDGGPTPMTTPARHWRAAPGVNRRGDQF